MAMTGAAWFLSWCECCCLALGIDKYFDAKDGEFVLNHQEAKQKFFNIWSGKPKIEVRMSCYNDKYDWKWEYEYNITQKRYDYVYKYVWVERERVFETKE